MPGDLSSAICVKVMWQPVGIQVCGEGRLSLKIILGEVLLYKICSEISQHWLVFKKNYFDWDLKKYFSTDEL